MLILDLKASITNNFIFLSFFSHFFGVSNTHIILQNGHVIKIREKLIRFRDRSVTKLKNFVIDLSKNGYLLHFFLNLKPAIHTDPKKTTQDLINNINPKFYQQFI